MPPKGQKPKLPHKNAPAYHRRRRPYAENYSTTREENARGESRETRPTNRRPFAGQFSRVQIVSPHYRAQMV